MKHFLVLTCLLVGAGCLPYGGLQVSDTGPLQGWIGNYRSAHQGGYSSGQSNGIVSGVSGGLNGAGLLLRPQVTKSIFVHVAPDMPPPPPIVIRAVERGSSKHYNIIVVKTPSTPAQEIVLPQVNNFNQEKTLIYLLQQNPLLPKVPVLPAPLPAVHSNPEVFLVKYDRRSTGNFDNFQGSTGSFFSSGSNPITESGAPEGAVGTGVGFETTGFNPSLAPGQDSASFNGFSGSQYETNLPLSGQAISVDSQAFEPVAPTPQDGDFFINNPAANFPQYQISETEQQIFPQFQIDHTQPPFEPHFPVDNAGFPINPPFELSGVEPQSFIPFGVTPSPEHSNQSKNKTKGSSGGKHHKTTTEAPESDFNAGDY